MAQLFGTHAIDFGGGEYLEESVMVQMGSYSGRNLRFVYASSGTWVRTIPGWLASGCIMASIGCLSLVQGVCFEQVICRGTGLVHLKLSDR